MMARTVRFVPNVMSESAYTARTESPRPTARVLATSLDRPTLPRGRVKEPDTFESWIRIGGRSGLIARAWDTP